MDLVSVLKLFKDKRILVIGDLILDCYVWGKVTRISPEAPVPVVDVTGNSYSLGGAANVANNIVSLGGKATVIGVIGNDWAAQTIQDIMHSGGIDFIAIDGKRPTTLKTRVIAHSQQVVRFDQENRDKISGKELGGIVEAVKSLIKEHDAVIVSDYKKGVISLDVMKTVIKSCGGKKFIAVDPKVGHFHLYKGASLITPNLMEAAQGSGMEIKDEKSLLKAGRKLLSNLNLKALLVTRGAEGMSLFQKSGVIHIPTLARKVFDVTGAGDTVIAAFTLAHTAKASLEDAAVLANHAAGIVVAEVGTATATKAKILKSIRNSKFDIVRTGYGH